MTFRTSAPSTIDGELLHLIGVKGTASSDSIATALGISFGAAEKRLAALGGLIQSRPGRFGGWRLTEGGRLLHSCWLAGELNAQSRERLNAHYDRFEPVNARFKLLCTQWQVRDDNGAANDHSDPAYDFCILGELTELHGEISRILADLSADCTRLARYQPALTDALNRLRGGDLTAFSRPMSVSYQDVWMELHQDLLVTLGRSRGDGDQ